MAFCADLDPLRNVASTSTKMVFFISKILFILKQCDSMIIFSRLMSWPHETLVSVSCMGASRWQVWACAIEQMSYTDMWPISARGLRLAQMFRFAVKRLENTSAALNCSVKETYQALSYRAVIFKKQLVSFVLRFFHRLESCIRSTQCCLW